MVRACRTTRAASARLPPATKVNNEEIPGRLCAAGVHVYVSTPAAVVGFSTAANGDLVTDLCVWDASCGSVAALPGLAPWVTSQNALTATASCTCTWRAVARVRWTICGVTALLAAWFTAAVSGGYAGLHADRPPGRYDVLG
uniref:Uncharacterized protein n=1 Tax=Actinomadura fulva subsp. indica TaxID=1752060 RepID=A0A1B4Z994_9ACTN|nr:hypothetical protein [Actinomadura fulva subsp. indica]